MEPAASFLAPFAVSILGVLVLILTVFFSAVLTYRLLKANRLFVNSAPGFPGLKESTWNPFGLMYGFMPSYSTRKKMSLPLTAYIGPFMTGLSLVFRNEKLIGQTLLFRDVIVLLKPESVEEFLSSKVPKAKPWVYLLTPWFGHGLFTSAGPTWKSRRKILNPMFSSSILMKFVPTFDKHSKILVDVLKSRHQEEWIDIVDPMALCSMDIIGDAVLGDDLGSQRKGSSEYMDAMVRASHAVTDRIANPIMHLDMIYQISAAGRQFKKDVSYMHTYVQQVIQRRKDSMRMKQKERNECTDNRKTEETDLLRRLLDLHMNNKDFSEESVREEIISFVFGGQDTTAAAMTWALYLVGLHPEIQSKVHEELDGIFQDDHDRSVTTDDLKEMRYLECVLKESQRLYPSVPTKMSQVLEDFHMCGHKVKKGSVVVYAPWMLHRDPEAFRDPEKFDPDRFLPENSVGRNAFAYFPFSAGGRTCIGQRFAMMELKTVIGNVLRNFSVKSLEQRDNIILLTELILRSLGPVKLKFMPRRLTQTSPR